MSGTAKKEHNNRETKRLHAVIDTGDHTFNHYWNKLIEADPGQSPLYAPARKQEPVTGHSFIDHSFMVLSEQEPVFGCSLTQNQDKHGRRRLGFMGREASTLVNRRSLDKGSNNFQPEVIRLLQDHFRKLIDQVQPDYLEYLDPVSCGLMSPLTQVLLECGALPSMRKSQIINLALSEADLLNKVDSRYRKLIDWGLGNLHFNLIQGERLEDIDSRLPELCDAISDSAAAAGIDSWSSFETQIRAGRGFIVQASPAESQSAVECVSGLFIHNQYSCHYVLDDAKWHESKLALIHALLWRAIQHSKQLNCRHFDFGAWPANHGNIDPQLFGGVSHTRIKISLRKG